MYTVHNLMHNSAYPARFCIIGKKLGFESVTSPPTIPT